VPYIPVASLSMQERVRLIERVLALAGLEPLGARAREDVAPARNGHRESNGSHGLLEPHAAV
jgi:hypothetical protein